MTTPIQLVQGFVGEISYILNFNGNIIDVSRDEVEFNFTDRREQNRHSIRCMPGNSIGEVKISFNEEDTAVYGEFFGEFVVYTRSGVDIYPITDRIPILIRKRI